VDEPPPQPKPFFFFFLAFWGWPDHPLGHGGGSFTPRPVVGGGFQALGVVQPHLKSFFFFGGGGGGGAFGGGWTPLFFLVVLCF
jgi:hypothetical protein